MYFFIFIYFLMSQFRRKQRLRYVFKLTTRKILIDFTTDKAAKPPCCECL